MLASQCKSFYTAFDILMIDSPEEPSVIWIASYPRSGNTLLRTALWQCFGLRSGSSYPNDLGGKKALEEYVGHIAEGTDSRIHFPPGTLPLIKTHGYPTDANPAIYVVRNGIAASLSLHQFYVADEITLDSIIDGQFWFGTWAKHLETWSPWDRPNTLLIKYEDMADNLPEVLKSISSFLRRPILATTIPDRNDIAGVDGRWVRNQCGAKPTISGDLLDKFNEKNGAMMRKMGYID